jgi:hypothetical protein
MGELGKYTTYVGGVATDAHKLLAKLFPGSPLAVPLTQGDEVAARKIVTDIATAKVTNGVGGIQPSDGLQQGDLGMFPTPVPLGFGASPDVTTVKWNNAGDPASPYIPDTRSPDPVTGQPNASAPDGADVNAIMAEGTKEDPARQDLRVPSKDGPAIYGNSTIGKPQVKGDSGGNV